MYKILKNIIEMDDYSVQKLSKSQPPEPFEWNTVEGTELNVSDCIGGKGKIAVKGNTYQKSRILPEGYTQVDYIESSRTQYIDTGFKPNQDTKIETKLNVVSRPTQYGDLFGSREETTNQFHIIIRDNGLDGRYGTENYVFNKSELGLHSIVFDKNSLTIDDVTHTYSQQTFSSNYNAYIFGVNSKGSVQYPSVLKLYTFKIYDNNILVRNFIPCYRNSDNEVGLYDIVNNVFYTNQGTGAFTYGSVVDIPNPEYPQEIKVVTGNNVIKHVGKNLFDIDSIKENKVIINDGSFSNNDVWNTSDFIYVGSFNNIFISAIIPGLYANRIIAFWDKNKQFLDRITTTPIWSEKKLAEVINIENSAEYITLSYRNDQDWSNIQIEQGTTSTPYEPYREEEYELSLGTMELCKIGDYSDILFKNEAGDENYNAELESGAWYEKSVIKKNYINGSESWRTSIVDTSVKTIRFARNVISVSNSPGYCNKLHVRTIEPHTDTEYLYLSGTVLYININKERLSELSVNGFISFLQENNIINYYIPLTSEYTKITDPTLISQLEALRKAKWFKGVNHWWTETNNLESVLKGTYRQAINE